MFVTRAERNLDAQRGYPSAKVRCDGNVCDQTVAMNGFYTSQDYPDSLRHMRFKDPETGKTLVFLTNNTALPALTIASLHEQRCASEIVHQMN